MPNQYLQQLTEIRLASGNFLLPISDDPSGTATLKKITVYNLLSGVTGGGGPSTWGSITGTLSSQTDLQSALDAKAAISSLGQAAYYNSGQIFYNTPMSGTPTAPTAADGTNTTQLATTAFVTSAISNASGGVKSLNGRTGNITLTTSDVSGLGQAALYDSGTIFYNSPLSGIPTAPTAAYGTNTTQLATTAFVNTLALSVSGGSTPNISAYSVYANPTASSANPSGVQTLILGTPAFNAADGTLFGQTTLSTNNYAQFVIQNTSKGSSASTDLIVNNDAGTDSKWFVDLGINSTSGALAPFPASGAAYLYASDSNEFNIGCLGSSGTIQFWIGSGVSRAGYFDNNLDLNLSKHLNIAGDNGPSNSTFIMSGVTYIDGTGSTTWPQFFIAASGGTNVSNWSTAGTILGINAQPGFLGNAIDIRNNSTLLMSMSYGGTFTWNGGTFQNNGVYTSSNAGTASRALIGLTNAPFSGGTSTTSWPQYRSESTTATVTCTNWNALGTYIGVNAPSNFQGNFLDYHKNNSASLFSVAVDGTTTASFFAGNGSPSASTSALILRGTILTGATGTTNLPHLFIQPSGSTAVTNWSANGTVIGVNANSGFGGNFMDLRVNGGSTQFSISNGGIVNCNGLNTGGITASNITASTRVLAVPSQNTPAFNSSTSTVGISGTCIFGNTPGTGGAAIFGMSGCIFGANVAANFSGNFIDCHVNGGSSLFNVNYSGLVNATAIQLRDNGLVSSLLKANSSGLVVAASNVTDYVQPSVTTAYSGQHYVIPVALASGNTVNWDMDVAPNAILRVPSGAFTLANPTNIRAGACGMLTIIQDPVGSRVITWGSAYKFAGGTKFVLSTAANARDEISWYSPDGTNVDCTGLANFS